MIFNNNKDNKQKIKRKILNNYPKKKLKKVKSKLNNRIFGGPNSSNIMDLNNCSRFFRCM